MRRVGVVVFVLAACSDPPSTPDAPVGPPGPDADPATPDATPREVIMETVPLLATEIVEAVMVAGPGDAAGIHLSAPFAEIDWNIHGHDGGGTQIVDEDFNQMTVDYQFMPTSSTDWYLLIRNSGGVNMDVQLRIELFGATTWSGWQ
jgi:hypothetical protein